MLRMMIREAKGRAMATPPERVSLPTKGTGHLYDHATCVTSVK